MNKCEDEFKKQDIYVDWKEEKKEYEESKSKLKPAEQAEREEELNFRRIKIKKQMLGNIKFIGQRPSAQRVDADRKAATVKG